MLVNIGYRIVRLPNSHTGSFLKELFSLRYAGSYPSDFETQSYRKTRDVNQNELELSERVVITLFKIAVEAEEFRWCCQFSQSVSYNKWTVEDFQRDFVISNCSRRGLQVRGIPRKGIAYMASRSQDRQRHGKLRANYGLYLIPNP